MAEEFATKARKVIPPLLSPLTSLCFICNSLHFSNCFFQVYINVLFLFSYVDSFPFFKFTRLILLYKRFSLPQ